MTRKQKLLYSILSSVLLTAGYYPFGSGLFMLVGFVPLLIVEDYITRNKEKYKAVVVYKYAFITFGLWNLLGMWWVYNASPVAIVAVILIGGTLMSIFFTGYHLVNRYLGRNFANFAFITFWLTFEYFFLRIEISNPWFTLGYGFQNSVKLVQWYEYTGSLGGSFWILLVNIIVFNTYKIYFDSQSLKKVRTHLSILLILIIVPIGISLIRYYTYTEKENPYEMVVVQPNVDPYMKFNDIPSAVQTQDLIDLADSLADENTDYIIAPETCINNNIWVDRLNFSNDLRMVNNFLSDLPKSKYVLGLTCYERYDAAERSSTARPLGSSEYYYDRFNSAIQLDSTLNMPLYHKSQLVTGVEKMPYADKLRFLEKLTLNLGGTMRSNGIQETREVFISPQDSIAIAPVICWESVYGEYVTDYVKLGADFIFIVTNDGWWGNTPGHVQHNAIGRIRAVENRRSIARSANTGISSFINQRGDVLLRLNWGKKGAIKANLNANDRLTFYVQHGDYIGRIANFFTIILLLYLLVDRLKRLGKTSKV